MNRTAVIVVVIVAALALLVTGVWVFGSSDSSRSGKKEDDPRAVFVAAAAPLCEEHFAVVGALDIPVDMEDPTQTVPIYETIIVANEDLAVAAKKLPASDSAVELRAILVEEAEARAELYRAAAANPSADDSGQGIIDSFLRVAEAFDKWGESRCGIPAFPGAVRADEIVTLANAAMEMCESARSVLIDVDGQAAKEDLTREEYYKAAGAAVADLADELKSLAPHPLPDNVEPYEALIKAVEDTSTAASEGNAQALAAASQAWVNTAEALSLVACTTGFSTNPNTPSGFLLVPPPPVAPSMGVPESGIASVSESLPVAIETIFGSAGVDPEANFSVNQVIPAAFPALTVVPGDQPATATAVSVSQVQTEADDNNPYRVVLVFGDVTGACQAAHLYGYPTLTGFEPLGPSACTANSVA